MIRLSKTRLFIVGQRLWSATVDAHPHITDLDERKRIQVFLKLIFILNIITLIRILIDVVIMKSVSTPFLILLLSGILIYVLGKTVYQSFTHLAMIVSLFFISFIYFSFNEYFYTPSQLMFLVGRSAVNLMFVRIFLSFKRTLVLGLILFFLNMIVAVILAPTLPVSLRNNLVSLVIWHWAMIAFLVTLEVFYQYQATLRVDVEKTLVETESRYQTISNAVSDFLYNIVYDSTSGQWQYKWLGGAVQRITGYSQEEFQSQPLFDNIYLHDQKIMNSRLERLLIKDDLYDEYRILLKDQSIRWVSDFGRVVKRFENGDIEIFGTIKDVNKQKTAEIALRESEKRYRIISDLTNDVAYKLRIENRKSELVWASDAVQVVFGYTVNQLKDLHWQTFVHPSDWAIYLGHYKRILKTGRDIQEFRIVHKNGDIRWLRDYSFVEPEIENPQILCVFGATQDITESKQADAALEAQRMLSEALRETASFISSTLDLNEVLKRILEQLSKIVEWQVADIMLIEGGVAKIALAQGYEAHSTSSGDISKIVFDVETTPTMIATVKQGKTLIVNDVWDNPSWIPQESTKWIRSSLQSPVRIEGQVIGLLNIASDIPNAFDETHALYLQAFADQVAIAIRNARLYEEARHYADNLEFLVQTQTAALNLERNRLQSILDSTAEGVFYLENAEVVYVNKAFCDMLFLEPETLIGLSIKEILSNVPTEDRRAFIKNMIRELRQKKVWRGELRIPRGAFTPIDLGLTVSIVGSRLPSPIYTNLVVIARDISLETALKTQQSNLLAFASHELRTPITNLKTRIYLLKRAPDQFDEHLRVLEQVSNRMHQLVTDLLDMSRLERGLTPLRLRNIRVCDLVQSVVYIQQQEALQKSIKLSFVEPQSELFILGDMERLTQVLTNLIANAINYTPVDGEIIVSAEHDPHKQSALIHIDDTGIGISETDLQSIFQPFFRVLSSVEGTGLGLSISKEIVEMHGGQIHVKSHLGQGSRFTIQLPISEKELPNRITDKS